MRPLKILIACECSGRVRDAFIARGFDAMSCDIKPTEVPGPHYMGSVFDILDKGWDLLIAHPPCTYLTYAGTRHWHQPGREELRDTGMRFFLALYNANIKYVAVENPVGYPNTIFRKPDQIIHPYYFGDAVQKRTCLWLRNLPRLDYSKTIIAKPEPMYICQGEKCKGKKINWCEGNRGEGNRATARSRTFPGIANAMAEQWGAAIIRETTQKGFPCK
jgi:hypothetical protein